MESQVVKGLVAIVFVMLVGFGIIAMTKPTEQEKQSGAFLATSSMLASSLALDKCSAAVKQEIGANPYSPSESDTDRRLFVKLVWNNVGNAKRAECRYVMDQGITLLQIDDRNVIKKRPYRHLPAQAPAGMHHQ